MELTLPLSDAVVQALLQRSSKSLVGKGSKTVLDERIRKSTEILAEQVRLRLRRSTRCGPTDGPPAQIALAPAFEGLIQEFTKRTREALMHPVPLKAQLHKLIIYRPGDKFDDVGPQPHSAWGVQAERN